MGVLPLLLSTNRKLGGIMKTTNLKPAAIWGFFFLIVIGAGVMFRLAFDALVPSGEFSWLGSLLSGAVVGGLGVLFLAVVGSPTKASEFTHSRRVTGYNMKRVIRSEGLAGNQLVGIGMFRLFFQQTDETWEYKQVTEFGSKLKRTSEAISQGWSIASTLNFPPWRTTHLVRSTGKLSSHEPIAGQSV
jgi:hypothetical protein